MDQSGGGSSTRGPGTRLRCCPSSLLRTGSLSNIQFEGWREGRTQCLSSGRRRRMRGRIHHHLVKGYIVLVYLFLLCLSMLSYEFQYYMQPLGTNPVSSAII